LNKYHCHSPEMFQFLLAGVSWSKTWLKMTAHTLRKTKVLYCCDPMYIICISSTSWTVKYNNKTPTTVYCIGLPTWQPPRSASSSAKHLNWDIHN
jgi:hypothetical protein